MAINTEDMAVKIWKKYLRPMRKYLHRLLCLKYLLNPYVLTMLFSMGLWQIGTWQSLEYRGFNLLFCTRHLLPHSHWDSRIAVIGIDDATLAEYGQFPLSRDRYTQLLESLEASSPAAVGFDILFLEPTPEDTKLAEAMSVNGEVVVAIAPSWQKHILHLVPVIDRVTAKGHIVSNADLDGVTRQLSLYLHQVPSFSVVLTQAYQNSLQQTFTPDQNKIEKSSVYIPSPVSGVVEQSAWINSIAPTQGNDGIPTYSFADVIKGKIDTDKLKNKILLVGLTATGTNDTLKTPFEQIPPTSGIYFHAAAIDNLLNNRLLQHLPWQFDLLVILVVGIGFNFILLPLNFQKRTLVLGLLPVTWFGIAVLSLSLTNFWIPTAAPIGTMLLAGLTVQWQEQREKQQLMSLFARHVSPETAKLIWQHRSEIFQNGQLDAQEMVATVLFTDIRSFTSISEGMPSRELLTWLNNYLGAMTQCIHEHDGLVDKYIGDAIMAIFGIPLAHTQLAEIQQDAIHAVAAAISMQNRLVLLNQELAKQGLPTITIGIGIHTGSLVAGSIGGFERLNYSVVGDAVNIAARLEQLNKETKQDNPDHILISETTFHLIKDHFRTHKMQQLQLRGRQQSTMIYSVIGNVKQTCN